jgi:hypothetical protein
MSIRTVQGDVFEPSAVRDGRQLGEDEAKREERMLW